MITTVSAVPRRAFDNAIYGYPCQHQVGAPLGIENGFQKTGVKGTHPRFGNHQVFRFGGEVGMDASSPRPPRRYSLSTNTKFC